MKTINLYILLGLAFITSCNKEGTIAQIGKPVPNYTFSKILNSNDNEISLQDLKGKVVILEFWATWCGPCIPAMKKLDSLQKEFKDELAVITISSENKERLEKFIKSSKTGLMVVSDTMHSANFKYKVIPHSIIIDKNGIVRAITSPEHITKAVVSNLILKDQIELESKDDFYINPNLEVKLIKSISNSNYRIELKNYDQEKRGSTRFLIDTEGNVNGIDIWNSTLPRLYQSLFDVSSPSRIVFRDSLSENDFPYDKEYQYNFRLEVSSDYQNKWRTIGIAFLNENFDVNAKRGIKNLECYVLKNIDNTIEESSSDKTEYMFMGTILKTKKIKISQLAAYLENFTDVPVVDKTNLKGDYDIEFEWQAEDPKTLHSELRTYGLIFERSDEKLPVDVMEIYKKQ
jgi:uncharacterized protein (TIGR03435 family)